MILMMMIIKIMLRIINCFIVDLQKRGTGTIVGSWWFLYKKWDC